jgi:hypothetical protein
MNLPIPKDFYRVREVVHAGDSFVLIVSALMAGKRYRYNCIRVFHRTGTARTIGRELPYKLARAVSVRGSSRDSMPVEEYR